MSQMTVAGEHPQVKNPGPGSLSDTKSPPFGVPDGYDHPLMSTELNRSAPMLTKPTLETIETAAIVDPRSSQRTIDLRHVAHLADSLTEISQMQPIVVKRQSSSPQYLLHDGAHRLLAAQQKGLASVQALVFDASAADDHIRRCILERDFLTREDSWAIRCIKLQELKSLYESFYPATKPGQGKRGKSRDKQVLPAFVAYIARESGDKKSTIAEMLTLAKILGPSLLRKIDEHQLPKQVGKDLGKVATEAERTTILEKMVEMQKPVKPGRRADLTVAAARYEIERDARNTACEATVLTSDDVQVIHSKMEDYTGIAPDSIDAIITDPLYHREHLHLYGKAAEVSARVLKPGGFAAFYCGRLYVNEIFGLLGEHLRLRTFITLHHKEHFGNVGTSKLSNDSKYILVYQKSGADVDFYTSVPGVIEGTGQEKGSHVFQQSVSDLDTLIDAISQPGETILDMFAGSGTTGVAAVQKGRRTILIEMKKVHYNTCCTRLMDALARRNQRPIPFRIPSIIPFISTDSTASHPDDVSDEESDDLRTAM